MTGAMQIFNFLKQNDLPNWIAAAFTIIVWPLAIFLWNRRSVGSIRNLDIIISPAKGTIQTGESTPYLIIELHNKTGQVIHLTNAVINPTKNLKANDDAEKDLATGSYTLKFSKGSGDAFARLRVTIETGSRVTTGLPLSTAYSQEEANRQINLMRSHRPFGLRSKYFVMKYDALVGRELKRVKFNF